MEWKHCFCVQLVICCCITGYPRIWWFKIADIYYMWWGIWEWLLWPGSASVVRLQLRCWPVRGRGPVISTPGWGWWVHLHVAHSHGCLWEASVLRYMYLSIGQLEWQLTSPEWPREKAGRASRCCWWPSLWRCKRCLSVPALALEKVSLHSGEQDSTFWREGISYFKLSRLLVSR